MIPVVMSSWDLVCTVCGGKTDRDAWSFRCPCGGPLDVQIKPQLTRDDLEPIGSQWRYRNAVPVEDDKAIVSLGEGMTPVLKEVIDGETVFLKLEYLAPTGSFKDRGASVLLSRLKEMGVEEILEDSSGNAGCALAAYAAAAGIRCRVLVPENVPRAKAIQIASYGAVVERIPGSRDRVAAEALKRSEQCFYASHNWQPFFLQGTKTFAYEVFEQLSPLPDAVFYPIGNGSLLLGTYKGFNEMKVLGWIETLPRLIGVQAVSHSPIYTEVTGSRPEPARDQTIANGIAIGAPARLAQVAQAIRDTGGTVVVVDDDQIRDAQRTLAHRGYLVEPTSAAALAGFQVWRGSGQRATERLLVPLTGFGLKDLDSFEQLD